MNHLQLSQRNISDVYKNIKMDHLVQELIVYMYKVLINILKVYEYY